MECSFFAKGIVASHRAKEDERNGTRRIEVTGAHYRVVGLPDLDRSSLAESKKVDPALHLDLAPSVAGFTAGALFSTRHAHLLSDIPAAFAFRAQLASVFLSVRMPAMCVLTATFMELTEC